MNCYYDSNSSVGVCSICARGLCRECAQIVEDRLCCEGCRMQVAEAALLLKNSDRAMRQHSQMLRRGRRSNIVLGAFLLVIGGIVGYLSWESGWGAMMVFGVAIAAWGGAELLGAWRARD